MHELGIIQSVCKEVQAIAEDYKAKEVVRVVLEVSGLSHMNSHHLEDTFSLFREASPLFRNTKIEFRQNSNPSETEIILRDVELEIEDE
ncbi:hydrogenase maturation nickel metallochaperone HypA [bacterium]|nr:hydrogenase maturation nickel metallochaperone HypA [bacterium]MCI0618580.1 hydrogenase maturation nickel metallochaperone HypA [bacterium]